MAMEHPAPIQAKNRSEFRSWLFENHESAKECWAFVQFNGESKGLTYLDAVEEALCFGWIDSTKTKDPDGRVCQRFSPRRKGSSWTELNKARCRRLERLGLMTDAGRAVMPDLDEVFVIEDDILAALKEDPIVWENIQSFPELYVRVRIHNIQAYKPERDKRLERFIAYSRRGEMYGEWNDGGKLP